MIFVHLQEALSSFLQLHDLLFFYLEAWVFVLQLGLASVSSCSISGLVLHAAFWVLGFEDEALAAMLISNSFLRSRTLFVF